MSTDYCINCETCNETVVPYSFTNSPEIPLCIVKNIISYTHLALFLEQLPVPKNAWLDYDIKIAGQPLNLDFIRKHATHVLTVFDEYGHQID